MNENRSATNLRQALNLYAHLKAPSPVPPSIPPSLFPLSARWHLDLYAVFSHTAQRNRRLKVVNSRTFHQLDLSTRQPFFSSTTMPVFWLLSPSFDNLLPKSNKHLLFIVYFNILIVASNVPTLNLAKRFFCDKFLFLLLPKNKNITFSFAKTAIMNFKVCLTIDFQLLSRKNVALAKLSVGENRLPPSFRRSCTVPQQDDAEKEGKDWWVPTEEAYCRQKDCKILCRLIGNKLQHFLSERQPASSNFVSQSWFFWVFYDCFMLYFHSG